MTIRTDLQIGGFSDYNESNFNNAYNPTTQLLDAADKQLSSGHIADSTDAITHIGVRVAGVVSSPPIYQVSLQSMGSTGLPAGTILGGGSPASATFDGSAWATNSFHWIQLDNPYTPSVGQVVMPVLSYSSGTIGTSNRIQFASAWTKFLLETRLPSLYTANNWSTASRTGMPTLGIRTANRRYALPIIGTSGTRVDLGTVGHRETLKFTTPGSFPSFTCHGLRVACRRPTTGNFKLGIWDSAGAEIQAESIDAGETPSTNDTRTICGFSTPVTITPGTTFYAGIERTDNACGLFHFELSEAGDQMAFPFGTAACRSAWNGSAWTDHTTFRPMWIDLLISDITGGGGGGAAFQLVGGGGLVY
jgi:hypothetical protein